MRRFVPFLALLCISSTRARSSRILRSISSRWSRKEHLNWDNDYCPGVRSLQFMINQATPTNPRPMYNDIDDMAISNTGPIGLIG